MGIREDAEAAYAKTEEAKAAAAKLAADQMEADRLADRAVAQERLEAWAADLGYEGRAVITSVSSPDSVRGNQVITRVHFSIDDLKFVATNVKQSFSVKLADDSTGLTPEIQTLEDLGRAIHEAERRKSKGY